MLDSDVWQACALISEVRAMLEPANTREIACAITKLDEAYLWLVAQLADTFEKVDAFKKEA